MQPSHFPCHLALWARSDFIEIHRIMNKYLNLKHRTSSYLSTHFIYYYSALFVMLHLLQHSMLTLYRLPPIHHHSLSVCPWLGSMLDRLMEVMIPSGALPFSTLSILWLDNFVLRVCASPGLVCVYAAALLARGLPLCCLSLQIMAFVSVSL